MSTTMSTATTMAGDGAGVSLSALARHTKRKIQWDRILRGSDTTRATQWKWLENARNFSIYTKQDSAKECAVLAIGVVKGSVPEIASLLVAASQDEYVLKMEALYDKEFKHGQFVDHVPYEPDQSDDLDQTDADNVQMSLRTATFAKTGGWLTSHDEWCYLESTTFRKDTQRFEKQLTTLKPQDVFPLSRKSSHTSSGSGAKFVRDVIASFRVEPDASENNDLPQGMEDGRESQQPDGQKKKPHVASRVHFYAEHSAAAGSITSSASTSGRKSMGSRFGRFSVPTSRHGASDKAVKLRLLQFAKSCDRLSLLVRRRRLGMQVVIDQKRVPAPRHSKCFSCDKSLRLVAKLCRVCGQGVCGDCSSKYERESHHTSIGNSVNRRVRLESVRVCDPCLARVDHADYSCISDAALIGATVLPNPEGAQPASADLKGLLHDALLNAPSPQRKGAVMSVIRCVLDQEKLQDELERTPPTTPSPLGMIAEEVLIKQKQFKLAAPPAPVLLTPVSGDKEYVDALDYLDVKPVSHTQAELTSSEGRAYAVDSRTDDLDAAMAYPLPDNEAQRLEAIHHNMLLEQGGGTFDELDIICDIAAKEVDTFASLITLITHDQQRVIGANMEALSNLVINREDAFCAHTIMDSKPLVIPHPESDIRFSRMAPVVGMGARYYCGFPIVADDEHKTVIGSLCCIDNKANALTESQYAVLQKLAHTASKIVKIEGAKRRSSTVTARPSTLPVAPTSSETENDAVSTSAVEVST